MLTEGITQGEIVFNRVDFSYVSRQEKILDNLSFKVKKGHNIAIVGRSGYGKSTILNLLMRFYDIKAGSILIDGIDIRDFDIRYLRSQIGVVNQEPLLINGTVRENIRYARPNASEAEVRAAA